jgi:predicted transcriptional regulator
MEMASGVLAQTNVIASGAYGITTSPARNRSSNTIQKLIKLFTNLTLKASEFRHKDLNFLTLNNQTCITCPFMKSAHITYLNLLSGVLAQTNVIASGAYGITTSPTRNRSSNTIKTKANDLLDQIKQLEIEGQKLRAQSLANLGKLYVHFSLILDNNFIK